LNSHATLIIRASGCSRFVFGIAGLGLMIPGYSHLRQTVSEIGEISSPARVPFAILLCCVAAFILVFASAVRDVWFKPVARRFLRT
jgi:hypothetical protein